MSYRDLILSDIETTIKNINDNDVSKETTIQNHLKRVEKCLKNRHSEMYNRSVMYNAKF